MGSSLDYYISTMRPMLKRGSLGFSVITLQQLLTAKGYDTRGITGRFDHNTEAAVKDFQRDNGLDQTGRFDDSTRIVLLTDKDIYKRLMEDIDGYLR